MTNFPVESPAILETRLETRLCEGRNGVPSIQIHETTKRGLRPKRTPPHNPPIVHKNPCHGRCAPEPRPRYRYRFKDTGGSPETIARDTHETDTGTSRTNLKTNPTHRLTRQTTPTPERTRRPQPRTTHPSSSVVVRPTLKEFLRPDEPSTGAKLRVR